MSPLRLGLGCQLGGGSWGPCLPRHPRGSNGWPVCAFQNQLLTKGMVILRDKIRFYEGKCGSLATGTECWAMPRASGLLGGWPCQPCLCPQGCGWEGSRGSKTKI